MKTVIKVASLLGCTLLWYANFLLPVLTSKITPSSSIAQAQSTQQQLTVALPETARIALKNGRTVSGRAIEISPQSLTLERSNESRKIDWQDVSSVQFDRDSDIWLEAGKPLVIRGEEGSKGQPLTLDIPTNQIQKLNPAIGHFRIDLGFLSNRARIRGILQVANDHLYVVEKIGYDPSKNVFTLEARPYLR